MQCPTKLGFTNRVEGSQPKCVYTRDDSKFVDLIPIQMVRGNGTWGGSWDGWWWRWVMNYTSPTIEELRVRAPESYANYTAEQTRATEAINVVVANIDKQKRVDDAFRGLQEAENARDTSPLAYQKARTAYYTLTNGESWQSRELERLTRAEVDPQIQEFRKNLADVKGRQAQQQKTVDVVDGLRDKVVSLKDDFKYSTDTLQRQLTKIKDQIILDRRKRQDQSTDSKWDLLDKGLNYALVAILLLAAWKIYQTYFASPSSGSSSSPSPAPLGAVK